MTIEFSTLDRQRTVLIEAHGDVTTEEVLEMRRHSVELAGATGFKNFIVDIRQLQSIARGSTYAAYDLGEQFSESGFSVWTNTAVLMPEDQAARDQVEFLHTVEINRGRGVINYVESFDEAYSWFEDMERRK